MTVAERQKGGEITTAIVIANFIPDSSNRDSSISTNNGRTRAIRHLPLLLGQRVEIDTIHGEWCHGRLADEGSKSGVFPLSFVSVVDSAALRSSQRSDRSLESGASTSVLNQGGPSHDPFLVEEVTNVLKEWWTACKSVYASQNMQSLDRVITSLEELMSARKRILSGNVMCEELKELKTFVARHIDLGNKWLGLDMVVRDETGYALDVDGISPVRAYREHLAAVNRIQQDTRPPGDGKPVNAFALFVELSTVRLDIKQDCELSIALYDAVHNKFLSENYTVTWSHENNALRGRQYKALFIDLGSKYSQDKVVLAVRVARLGAMESSSTLKKTPIIQETSSSQNCRQPYSFAICDVTEAFQPNLANSGEEKQHFVPLIRFVDDNFEQTMIKAVSGRLNTAKQTEGIGEGGQTFASKDQLLLTTQVLLGSLEQIKKAQPHLFALQPPTLVRLMGFPDVIATDDVRNDLYLTLSQADLGHVTRSSDKNIEARVSLVDSNGKLVDDSIVIVGADGVSKMATYSSLVFYHDDKPKWFETVKICIPDDTSKDVHIRIAFRHRRSGDKNKAEKGPFAVAFLKLLEGTKLLEDGQHELLVYKIEANKFDEKDISYTNLPSSKSDLKQSQSQSKPQMTGFVWSDKSSFTVTTLTCSTSLTHNVELLDVLKWKMNKMYLRQRLETIVVRPEGENVGTELVKFMGHFLDALFDIWAFSDDFDVLVFDALVFVLRLVDAPRYQNFKPVLDSYVRSEFHSAVAFEKLIPTLKDYIVHADTKHEKALNALKTLGYLMEFIVRSKENHARLPLARDGKQQPKFTAMVSELLNALVQLMQSKSVLMTCQNTALKHLPETIPHLMQVFDRTELTHFLIKLIDNLGPNLVARQRLSFLRDLVKTELFVDDDCRRMLLPKILGRVAEHIEKESSQKERRLKDDKKADDLQLCADILADILERLFGAETTIGNEDDLRLLTSLCLRPVLQTVISQFSERSCLAAYVALTVALLNEISTSNYVQYVHDRPTSLDKMDFLMEVLHVFRDLVTKPAFHPDWFQMICLQNKALLKMLRFVMSTMKEQFLGYAFDEGLWREYFRTAVSFITQRDLRFETFVERKRLNFFTRYKDMRRDCANDLRSMWFSLNMDQKIYFIPDMVGPFLEVSLIEDSALRDTTIPIFVDMMTCEFYSKTHTDDINQNFMEFENELIVQLDTLVDNNRGGPTYKDQFHKIMMERCNVDREMAPAGQTLIQMIDRLLTRLFEYRSVRAMSDCLENVMSRTVELLKFYKEIDQGDLYIRYVYKLYQLHKQSDNLIEAAYTLKKHADCLNWTEQPLPDWLIRNQHNRQCATHRQLKEQLFTEIATLFDDGRLWEKAIETLKELIPVYESSLFDYDKLSKLLDRQAALYRKIINQERAESEYFLVGFYGEGHPAFLRNTEVVFRGQSYEKLNDFQQRMLSTFTGSTLLKTMDIPTDEVRASDSRYLQIISVKPIQSKESLTLFADKHKVERLIKWYYKHNEVQKFEYSRPIKRPSKFSEIEENELTMMWVEKTVVVAGDKLPDILRWSKVTARDTMSVSPLEQAVNTMQRSNEDLFECAEDIRTVSKKPVVVLSGKLTGVIQAFVSGGIKNYNVFFKDECQNVLSDQERQRANKLKELIAYQIPILEYCLYVHASRQSEIDPKFHESLVDSFKSYRTTVESKFGKRPSRLPQGASIQLAQPPPTARFRPANTPLRTFSHADDSHSHTISHVEGKRISNGINFSEASHTSTAGRLVAAGLRSPLSMVSAGASMGRSKSSVASPAQRKSHSRQESTNSYFDQSKANKRLSNLSATSERSTNSSGSGPPIVLDQKPVDDNSDLTVQTTLSNQRPPRPEKAKLKGARRADSTPDINENSALTLFPLTPARESQSSISTGDILDMEMNMRLTTPSPQPSSFYVLPEVGDHPPPLPPRTSDLHVPVTNGSHYNPNSIQRKLAPFAKKEKPQPPLPTD